MSPDSRVSLTQQSLSVTFTPAMAQTVPVARSWLWLCWGSRETTAAVDDEPKAPSASTAPEIDDDGFVHPPLFDDGRGLALLDSVSTRLDVSSHYLSPGALATIIRCIQLPPWAAPLRFLHLNDCNLQLEQIQCVASYLATNPSITSLSLGMNALGPTGALELAGALMVNTHVEILHLAETEVRVSSRVA